MIDWASHLDWTVKAAAVAAAILALLALAARIKNHASAALKRAGHILKVPSGMVSSLGEKPGDVISESLRALVKSTNLRKIEVQLIQEKLEMGFYLCSPDGHCIETNPYLDDLFGLPSDEMVGYGWLSAVVDHQKHHVAEEWRASVTLGLPYRARYQILNHRTGITVWVRTAAYAITEKGADPTGYAGFLHADDDQDSDVYTAAYLPLDPSLTKTARVRVNDAKKQFLPSESLRICHQ